MAQIILHHYPQSPVSEKVRVAFGIKRVAWHSVLIPRLPPKPNVTMLTGGYRRTPIMQIGADIYCDSLCILHSLERIAPEPGLFPDGKIQWAANCWTDGVFFDRSVAVVLGSEVDDLPADFAADRGRLYFGPDHDLRVFQADLPHLVGQLRAHLHMMRQQLGNRLFMHGNRPGLVDALCYYVVWFLRGRYKGGPDLLGEFKELLAWEQRVFEIGHGTVQGMTAEEALEVALDSRSATQFEVDAADPTGFKAGDMVDVVPDGDGGDPPVHGELVVLTRERIAIRRQHERVAEVVVHFPRLGYRVFRRLDT